ncbi:tpr repeat-containing protein [Cystoisospora suis]|uniref:Tpr repeat-containing protein n=1 Tax=Cystoisospora suis TaxID=483139 RepID=A0A2C6KW78_9APIC|nr:tpr repeat-containing protein [Cystoisospora suis]
MAMHESEAFWQEFFRRPGAQKAVKLEQKVMMKEAATDLKHCLDQERNDLRKVLEVCSPATQDLIKPMLCGSRVKRLVSAVRERASNAHRSFDEELHTDDVTLCKLQKLRQEFDRNPVAFTAAEEQWQQVRAEVLKEVGPSDFSGLEERTWRDIPAEELAERLCKGEICPRDEWVPGLSKDKRPLDPVSLGEHLKLGERMMTDGRDAYAGADFGTALIRFTQGVQLLNWIKAERSEDQHRIDGLYLTFLRNQAQAALMLEKYQEAIKACTTIIQDIDEHDAKARYRRAKAYAMLGLIKCAKDDYLFVIKSPYAEETAVKACRVALAELRKIVNKYKIQTRETVVRSTAEDVFAAGRGTSDKASTEDTSVLRSNESSGEGAYQLLTHRFSTGPQLKEGNGLTRANARSGRARETSWFDPCRDVSSPPPPTPGPGTNIVPEHRNIERDQQSPPLTVEETKLLLEDLLDSYTRPEAQAALQQMSRDADFEMRRFLIRLRKFLPQVQARVFQRHGLGGKNHRDNLAIMERSVTYWRKQDEAVDELRRECWNALFGDLLDLDSA